MFFKTITQLLLLLGAAASLTAAKMDCASHLTEAQKAAAEAPSASALAIRADPEDWSATIKVHFHLAIGNATVSGGNATDSQIAEQMALLNNAFTGSGLNFELVNTTRTRNMTWFRARDHDTMRRVLRVGDESELNVFTFFSNGRYYDENYLFPFELPESLPWDGVLLEVRTLPGGTDARFNMGTELVHKVGHWLGLYDTYHGGCSETGDFVDDTPASNTSWWYMNSQCPTDPAELAKHDSCPDSPGADPIQNFMSGNGQTCLRELTPGQFARVREQLAKFRGITGKN